MPYTGRDFEDDFFGCQRVWDGEGKIPLVGYEEAINFVLNKQPNGWHPLRPVTTFGKMLLAAVRETSRQELDGRCFRAVAEYITGNTGLYIALDTPADFFHDTDAIICCDLGFCRSLVTVDLKLVDYEEGIFHRDNHVIITRDHFTQVASNGKLRLHNIAGVIAEHLVLQLEWAGVLSPIIAMEASAS